MATLRKCRDQIAIARTLHPPYCKSASAINTKKLLRELYATRFCTMLLRMYIRI